MLAFLFLQFIDYGFTCCKVPDVYAPVAAIPARPPLSAASLLIERVVIADGGLEIIWRDQGWQKLAGELLPGTIGTELLEWEQTEVEA
jgi:hypothetical protein